MIIVFPPHFESIAKREKAAACVLEKNLKKKLIYAVKQQNGHT